MRRKPSVAWRLARFVLFGWRRTPVLWAAVMILTMPWPAIWKGSPLAAELVFVGIILLAWIGPPALKFPKASAHDETQR